MRDIFIWGMWQPQFLLAAETGNICDNRAQSPRHRLSHCLSRDSWETPLGVVETDGEMADALAGSIIDHDEAAHIYEHSIEVQIPFIQRRFSGIKILPICMGLQDEEMYRSWPGYIPGSAKACPPMQSHCRSDFTHYEPQERARSVDARLLEAVLNMDVPETLQQSAPLRCYSLRLWTYS